MKLLKVESESERTLGQVRYVWNPLTLLLMVPDCKISSCTFDRYKTETSPEI